MSRVLAVLRQDMTDRASYGFMATATPSQFVKKAKIIMDLHETSINLNEDVLYANDIENVNLSMCTRAVSSSGFGGGLRTTVHIDMDFILKDGTSILLEVVRPDSFDDVFSWLHNNQINFEDKIGIEKVYNQIEGAGARNKYLSGNFGKFARKFKLDHPRKNPTN